MGNEFVSLDGTMYRVRSCTERHGVWVEKFNPADAGRRQDVNPHTGEVEADDWHFIPGDIKDAVADAIKETPCDISREDDMEYPHDSEATPCP